MLESIIRKFKVGGCSILEHVEVGSSPDWVQGKSFIFIFVNFLFIFRFKIYFLFHLMKEDTCWTGGSGVWILV